MDAGDNSGFDVVGKGGEGLTTPPLPSQAPPPVKGAFEGRSVTQIKDESGIFETIKNLWSRVSYAIARFWYAARGIQPSAVLKFKHADVAHFSGSDGKVKKQATPEDIRVGAEVFDYEELQSGLPAVLKKSKDEPRYCQINLATMHKGRVSNEPHNVTVLVDRGLTPPHIYVLDGKGQHPKNIKLAQQTIEGEQAADKTAEDFLHALIGDAQAQVTWLEEPFQRSMDCVIFPQVLRDRIIEKNKALKDTQQPKEPEAILREVMEEALREKTQFYGAINALRDRIFWYD